MAASEHFDVLVVGAGLSGIGAAYHLQTLCPTRSYAILEGRDAIGGTWDLFRYPGIRSDSDMYTLGYRFRPWKDAKAIADGPSIREYVLETAREHGIDRHVRFHHRVVRAEWSTEDSRWEVDVQRTDRDETVRMTADFVFMCSGYYRYDEGYTPELPGIESFGGQVIHPQHWPEQLDYSGKRVVVIGSGAPGGGNGAADARGAPHVTISQRLPSLAISLPGEDPIAGVLRRVPPQRG